MTRWMEHLASAYLGGAASVFLLHGNVHDLVPLDDSDDTPFVSLEHVLAARLFARRDVVVQYDRGGGIELLAPGLPERRQQMQADLQRTLSAIDSISGTSFASSRPKDPGIVFEILDRYLMHKVLESPKEDGKRTGVAVIVRYLETIVPATDGAWLAGEVGTNLVKILEWANEPAIRNADVTICLVTETLGGIHQRLVESPAIMKIEVPLPDETLRSRFAKGRLTNGKLSPEVIARDSNGLTLVSLGQAIARVESEGARGTRALHEAKKDLIEKQCEGLVEFVEPSFDLESVVAPQAVLERLRSDVALFQRGRYDTLPMGYLLCGVVGTGKTFTAKAFAGSLGIPAVLFRNLRSRWVGASEANLQKVLSVVKALGPVVVIIDEADAALGNRGQSGDSGTSGRMFSMISSLMSDTDYRGRILWMLLTCRPDLLPVDLKRQGRCEVHIPLFPPETEEERRSMLRAMAKKNGVTIDESEFPEIPKGLSGADIESLVVQAARLAAIDESESVGPNHLREAAARFIPPHYGPEHELQQLAAIRECTDRAFLPQEYQEAMRDPDRVREIDERLNSLAVSR